MPRRKTEDLTEQDIDLLRNIGGQVKLRRSLFGWTQSELAQRVGMKQETISQIENAATNMQVSTITVLARVFGVPFEDLLKPVDEIRRALGMPLEPRAAFEEHEKYRTKPKKAGRPPSGANKKAA